MKWRIEVTATTMACYIDDELAMSGRVPALLLTVCEGIVEMAKLISAARPKKPKALKVEQIKDE